MPHLQDPDLDRGAAAVLGVPAGEDVLPQGGLGLPLPLPINVIGSLEVGS